MGGKGSGNRHPKPVPRDKNPVVYANDARNVDPDTNRASVLFGKALFELTEEPVDLADPEAVKQRFYDFLDLCEENKLRPMMTGLAMAMAITPSQLSALGRGDEQVLSRRLTAKSRLVLKKAYDFMQVNWENNLQAEKGNPVKWLFLGKNWYGMRDQTERVVTHRDEGLSLPSAEETAAKYAAMVGRQRPKELEGEVVSVEDVPREG